MTLPASLSNPSAQLNDEALDKRLIVVERSPEFVTALPANPVHGQACTYAADAANGIYWHLKYDANSASSYKWVVVGGSPLVASTSVDASGGGTQIPNTWTTVQTVTVPLAGDYVIDYLVYFNGTPGVTAAHAAMHKNGTRDDTTRFYEGGPYRNPHTGQWKKASLAASDALALKVFVDVSSASALYFATSLAVRPVRVG